MNYRTGKILLITSLLLLPAAFSPARGEEPAFSYTHIHREGSVSTAETGRVETREKSSKKTTHSDISVDLPSSPAAGGLLYPYLAKNGLPGDVHRRRGESDVYDYGATAAFRDKKGWGLLDREGHEIVPASWDSISYEGNGLFQVKKGKKISYITADGRVASPDREEGPSFYREKGKYGILDDRGIRVTAPLYRAVLAPFSEGIAFVQLSDGRKGGIDGSGKLLFTAEFDSVGPYEDGLAEYRRKVNRFNWGTLAGAVLGGLGGSGGGDEMLPLSYDGVKRGYLDRQGRIVVDSRSDEVYPMTEWGTFVKDHGLLGFVNRKGEYIIPPGRYDLSGGMLYEEEGLVTLRDKEKGKMGAFRLEDGRQVMDFLYDRITFLGEDRVLYEMGGKTVLAGESGVIRELPSGAVMQPYSEEGLAWMEEGKKIHALDRDGKILFTLPEGEAVRPFRHGLAPVKSHGRWGLVDIHGQWVKSPLYKDVQMM